MGCVARVEKTDILRGFVGKPIRNRPLGRTRHTCEDNIKMDINNIGC